MNKLVFKYISIILAIYLASMLSGAVHVGSLGAVLVMGAVLLLVNLLIKPFLLLITLPLNILTLGLFGFVVNALTIMIADGLVAGGEHGRISELPAYRAAHCRALPHAAGPQPVLLPEKIRITAKRKFR